MVKKQCPKCGKGFKASGLSGHLRFVHGVGSTKAGNLATNANLDVVDKTQRIFELVEELDKIRAAKEKVHEKNGSFLLFRDEVCDELREALEQQERELLEKLKNLKAVKPGSLVEKLGKVFQG